MAKPPKRPTYLIGTEALFPEETGAETAPGAARGNSATVPGIRRTSTPGADAILNDPRSQVRPALDHVRDGVVDGVHRVKGEVLDGVDRLKDGIVGGIHHAKDGFRDSVDRAKGDAIGFGLDAATSFHPVDDLLSIYQRARGSASPRASAHPAARPAMSDNYRRLAQIIGMGEGNYESYNTGTKGVTGGGVGRSFINPLPGTVTGKTINQILATERLPDTHRNRMFAVGAYQTVFNTLRQAKEHLKLTGEERFTPELQDRIFSDFLISKAGGGRLAAFINNGRGTVDDAQYAAAQEWASVATPAGFRTRSGKTPLILRLSTGARYRRAASG